MSAIHHVSHHLWGLLPVSVYVYESKREYDRTQTHQPLTALWLAITSHTHSHPLAHSDFLPVAMQSSASLDPCGLLMEALRQRAGLICGQASALDPDDLYNSVPQCHTLSGWHGRAGGRGRRQDGSIPKQKLTWNKGAFLCSNTGNVCI